MGSDLIGGSWGSDLMGGSWSSSLIVGPSYFTVTGAFATLRCASAAAFCVSSTRSFLILTGSKGTVGASSCVCSDLTVTSSFTLDTFLPLLPPTSEASPLRFVAPFLARAGFDEVSTAGGAAGSSESSAPIICCSTSSRSFCTVRVGCVDATDSLALALRAPALKAVSSASRGRSEDGESCPGAAAAALSLAFAAACLRISSSTRIRSCLLSSQISFPLSTYPCCWRSLTTKSSRRCSTMVRHSVSLTVLKTDCFSSTVYCSTRVTSPLRASRICANACFIPARDDILPI
mmetsp:Transcript_74540/g.129262  ORF Transcript_74540/g.129262 Transcript_74540/m.129262 type:complete len:290 (-) Transcript_74540:59-928(-)